MEMIWEDPPDLPFKFREEWAAGLRANPGRWARYPREVASSASTVQHLRGKFPDCVFISVRGVVYGKYDPDLNEPTTSKEEA